MMPVGPTPRIEKASGSVTQRLAKGGLRPEPSRFNDIVPSPQLHDLSEETIPIRERIRRRFPPDQPSRERRKPPPM